MSSLTRVDEEAFSGDEDLYEYACSDFEQHKYELIVASLPRARYESAFEPGCSVGLLSELLASRCQRLLSCDRPGAALALASRRLKSFPNVRVQERTLPFDWPKETFDLVVLSELAYYFDAATLNHILDLVIESTDRGAHVVAVHRTDRNDCPLTGNYVHAVIDRTPCLRQMVHHVEKSLVLDVWERLP